VDLAEGLGKCDCDLICCRFSSRFDLSSTCCSLLLSSKGTLLLHVKSLMHEPVIRSVAYVD